MSNNINNIINMEYYIPYNMIFRMFNGMFNEIFNEMFDEMFDGYEYNIKNILNIPNINKEQFLSTMTMSFICFMKSISSMNNEDRKLVIHIYITNIKSNLSLLTSYKSNEYLSFFKRIFCYFQPITPLEYVSSPYSLEYHSIINYFKDLLDTPSQISFSYYKIQEKIHNLLCGEYNRYNSEYINVTTFGFFIYLKTIKDIKDKKKYLYKYISSLIYINILSDKISLYDKPDIQTTIINLNYRAFYKVND